MKKKLLALLLAAAMVFATVPAFAADDGTTYSVDESVIGTATNPLTVSYDSDGMNYLCLGDSVAFGYGLNSGLGRDDMVGYYGVSGITPTTAIDHTGATNAPGAFYDLIKKYFNCSDTSYLRGNICGARMEDFCTMIDPVNYPGDTFYYSVMLTATGLDTSLQSGDFSKVNNSTIEQYKSTLDEKLSAQMVGAIKEADFVTICAGGNNFSTYPLATIAGFPSQKTMEDYFGTTAVSAYNKMKDAIIEKAGDSTSKVENVFKILDSYLCSTAAFVQGSNNLLDLIHKTNPEAEIAITGIPDAFADYDLKVNSVIIDLDKVVRPLFAVINTAIKNAAEERSSYVRYIDISGVELISVTGDDAEKYKDMIVDVDDFGSLYANHTEITHPSYKGHKQIADRIMANFEFKTTGTYTSGVKNLINNVQTMLMSKIGLSKISNIIDSVKQINILGAIRIDLSTLIGDIFEKITNKS